MSVEDRIKAIEQRWEIPAGTLFELEIAMCDIEYLLSVLKKRGEALKRITTEGNGCMCGRGEWCENCSSFSTTRKLREIAKQALI